MLSVIAGSSARSCSTLSGEPVSILLTSAQRASTAFLRSAFCVSPSASAQLPPSQQPAAPMTKLYALVPAALGGVGVVLDAEAVAVVVVCAVVVGSTTGLSPPPQARSANDGTSAMSLRMVSLPLTLSPGRSHGHADSVHWDANRVKARL